MTDTEFYEKCARILGTVNICRPFPWTATGRTRWNNRAPGSGRFPGQGLVRLFGDSVQIALRHPATINATVEGRRAALDLIARSIPHPTKTVRIVGLAQIEEGRMLLVRKRGASAFILPGGKPDADDLDDLATLNRECLEELGCAVDDPIPVGTFRDEAADAPGVHVEVALLLGTLRGKPSVQAEIEEMAWVDMRAPEVPVAPSLANLIFPVLLAKT